MDRFQRASNDTEPPRTRRRDFERHTLNDDEMTPLQKRLLRGPPGAPPNGGPERGRDEEPWWLRIRRRQQLAAPYETGAPQRRPPGSGQGVRRRHDETLEEPPEWHDDRERERVPERDREREWRRPHPGDFPREDYDHPQDDDRYARRHNRNSQSRTGPPRQGPSCTFCVDSELCSKIRGGHFIGTSARSYIVAQTERDMLLPFHSAVVPIEHVPTTQVLENDTLMDIRNFKKTLIYFFKNLESDTFVSWGYGKGPYVPLFVEWHIPRGAQTAHWAMQAAANVKSSPHTTIDVIPLKEDDFENAKIIIAKEFESMGGDVSRVNKAVRTHSPSPRLGVKEMLPNRSLPFIYVDFALEEAYLHTLEDSALRENLADRVDRRFMRSLLQGLLPEGLRHPPQFDMRGYLREYQEMYRQYDWTTQQ